MQVTRLPLRITHDPRRVIFTFLVLSHERRIQRLIRQVGDMPADVVDQLLADIYARFQHRHAHFEEMIEEHYVRAIRHHTGFGTLSRPRQLLLGAYFSKEYSNQAVALFNPSIVAHPDQQGVAPGALRFVMSLRATGEGHLSSLEFRVGTISAEGEVSLDEAGRHSQLPELIEEKFYDRAFVQKRLPYLPGLDAAVLARLPRRFTLREAFQSLDVANQDDADQRRSHYDLLDLLEANYDVYFPDGELSERVIFPYSKREQVGIEDVRFVRFVHNDGSATYYGTYTAYNGRQINTQLIRTEDFIRFSVRTLHGAAVHDKGMALFPRKVNGQYVMTSRQDGENLFIMRSDDLYFWQEAQLLRTPEHPWELTQMGNCGSPIETEAGWLLLTHAVGPVRRYVLSACLLDLDDPTRVIGALQRPLMEPNEDEREGYVPNVVYTCGWLRHGDQIIIPYAMSDSYTGFARVSLPALVDALQATATA